MSAENKVGYMLLFRGTDWAKGLSPEEMQKVAGQWMDWFQKLQVAGKATGGQPLDNSGKVVSGKNGRTVTDGPFAESKEAIGGYFLLNVDSIEEATAIAQGCPGLAYGTKVEVRALLDACPLSKIAKPELADAAA